MVVVFVPERQKLCTINTVSINIEATWKLEDSEDVKIHITELKRPDRSGWRMIQLLGISEGISVKKQL